MTKDAQKSKIETIREKLRNPLVIVGMMGSGKTRIGARLAEMLGMDFFDADRLVEERAGRSISEIFALDGEAKFREAERKVLLELLDKTSCVIATGGGAVMIPGVMDAVKRKSVSLWLKADVAEILERVGNSEGRPLLKGDNREAVLRELLSKREPVYARADITVDTKQGNVSGTAEAAINELYGFLKRGSF